MPDVSHCWASFWLVQAFFFTSFAFDGYWLKYPRCLICLDMHDTWLHSPSRLYLSSWLTSFYHCTYKPTSHGQNLAQWSGFHVICSAHLARPHPVTHAFVKRGESNTLVQWPWREKITCVQNIRSVLPLPYLLFTYVFSLLPLVPMGKDFFPQRVPSVVRVLCLLEFWAVWEVHM